MQRFLIDVNLPRKFRVWHSENFIHQFELDPFASDADIWEYAKKHDLTIVTKDSDFSGRILLLGAPPKIIHLRIGNMPMKAFHDFVSEHWVEMVDLSEGHSLVVVHADRMECIK
jgi:predicted nuclease of predicted toxin-antitoxin system